MTFEEALTRFGAIESNGYSENVIESKSRGVWMVMSKYGLAQCSQDWPIPFYPCTEDKEATDWTIRPKQLTPTDIIIKK